MASLALSRFVKEDKTFDFTKLIEVVGVVVRNLNKIIDINDYPVPEVGGVVNNLADDMVNGD